MSVRIHPRENYVRAAERELSTAIDEMREKHSLTLAETLRVVNKVASEFVSGIVKFWIREERHGDPEIIGGFTSHRNGCGDPTCEGCK